MHWRARLSPSHLRTERHRTPLPPTEADGTVRPVRTHCPYCAYQCGMLVRRLGERRADHRRRSRLPGQPRRALCQGLDRGRNARHTASGCRAARAQRAGRLVPTSWDEAIAARGARIAPFSGAHGRDAVAVFGSGSLTNEKAYLLGKFARVALAPPTSTTTAASACPRRRPRAIAAFGLDRGLPFPLSDIAQRRRRSCSSAATSPRRCRRSCSTSRRSGARRQLIVVDPRRTATAQRADAAPAPDAGHRRGAGQRPAARAHPRRADRRGLHPRADRRLRGGPAHRRGLLAGARRAHHRRAARRNSSRPRAMLGTARDRDDPHRARRRAAGAGRRQRARLHQPRARPWQVGQAVQRLRHASRGRATARADASTGRRPISCPATAGIDDPAGARAHRRGLGRRRSEISRRRASRPTSCSTRSGATAASAALLRDGLEPGRLGAARDAVSSSASSALDFLVVSDFFLSETAELADVVLPSAQWAEEDGTMTNLEAASSAAAASRAAGGRAHRPRVAHAGWPRALGRRAAFRLRRAPRSSRNCGARARGRRPTSGHHLRADRRARMASSGRARPSDHPGTPRLFAERFPTPSGRARFHAVRTPRAGRGARRGVPAASSPRAACSRTTSRGRRRGASPQLCKPAPEPLAEMHPPRRGVGHRGRRPP